MTEGFGPAQRCTMIRLGLDTLLVATGAGAEDGGAGQAALPKTPEAAADAFVAAWEARDKKRIKELTRRGGKLVVIDPRFTETAQLASEHHYITPGSDALFLLAILNTLFEENLADPGHLADFTDGLDAVAVAIAEFTPEYAAPHTGISADDVIRMLLKHVPVELHERAQKKAGRAARKR